ncbi:MULTISPECIES: bifunctional DNA primase/polymerase [unclassified Streptomyces]|uniref:bifunctional DNA primase/polymerase n=1 Tax=unclassified Streptomyces TaxID=2593676 RepID=UPI0011655C25|nr:MULTISPECIES: bifunctional DNA primase/polymerase [unclassified Streptomyces]QDN60115.1 bifunctional DNA primase/polymerase [Streptomyces sp. S1D4-20]
MTQQRPGDQRPGPFWAAARAHALSAATLHGLPAFPLTRSKLPAIATAHREPSATCTGQCGQAGHGVHDASSDPARVRALFAMAPWAAGYGIACGRPPHYLIGLDLDRKNGVDGVAALHALARRHGFSMPATATVATQSGGLHLWLTVSTHVRITNSASLIARGIDVRGSGGYLVGPGSLGPRGRYRFVPGSGPRPIAPAPAPLLDLLTAAAPEPAPADRHPASPHPSAGGSPERRLDGLVRVVLDCGPNDLNNRLYWASRTAFEASDIDPDTATGRLLAAAVQRGHPETPARRTIASAAKGAARSKETRT